MSGCKRKAVIPMYSDLIKNLRETDFSDGCPCGAENLCKDNDCLIWQAADAIEELQVVVDGLTAQTNMVFEKTEGRTVIKFEPKWIPVTERLPDVGKDVLCFCRANICLVLGRDGNLWHEDADRYYMSGFVTHWMPLPEHPESGEA